MKQLSIAAALVSLVTVASIRTASAGDYVGGGVQLGSALDNFATEIGIEAGHQLEATSLVVRGQVARGQADDISEAIGSSSADSFYRGSSHYTRARLGIEHEACSVTGGLCGLAGVDVGLLVSGTTTGPRTDTTSVSYRQEQIIPRLGVDMGGEVVRVRLTIETAVGLGHRSDAGSSTEIGDQGVLAGAVLAFRF